MKKINNIGRLMFFTLVAFVLITACGRKGPDTPPNTMPAAFSFTAKTNVTPNTVVISNSITVSGINTAAPISIVGGEYSIDGGAYTSEAGTVMNGQAVTVQQTSSPNFGTTTNAVLTIGGISSIFSVTTIITTTTTTISAPPVQYGSDGTVTVTVSSAAGIPLGSVLLSVDGPQGTLILQQLSGGSTTFKILKPSAGSHTLNATYLPDGGFQGSSASGTLGVGVGATSMTLNAPEITYGTDGSVTVTVSATGVTPTGDVSLSVDSGAPMTQPLTGGSATFTLSRPSAPSHSLSATYATQGNFLGSSASGTLNVKQAPTTTTISALPVTYGENGSVTVTVSSTAGMPTGDVSLSVDSGAPMTQPLINGSATFTITMPTAGNHDLSATFAAQGNFDASSNSGTLGVGPGATSMTLDAPAVTYGTDGSVTVTVSSTAGTPTGDVSLIVDNGTPMIQTLSNGSTIFTLTMPSAGSHALSAAYAAQGSFGASSVSGTLNVNPAATTTIITAPPITYGENGSVTVTVTAGALIPTGDVSLRVDGGAPITQTLAGGSTTFTIPSPTAGSHDLSATYAAQGNFQGSSASGTLGVGPGATSMTLDAPPVTYGADGSVTVTVSSTVTPAGDVSLSVDGTPMTPQPLINGSTTFTIPMPSLGNHTLSAEYAAQGDFLASSASGTLSVKAATATDVTSDPNPSTFKTPVTFTATVTSTAGTPTGTVAFSNNGTYMGTGTLSGGTATFSTSTLSKGEHTITADYSGDSSFSASTSQAYSQTVQ